MWHACRRLMLQHSLAAWSLRLSSAARRLGSCSYRTRTIRLSRHLLLNNPWPEVRETMLHEIAHALVGQAHGHDAVWKAKAAALGASPRSCAARGSVVMPEPRWEAWCPRCKVTAGRYHRRPPRWRRGYVHDSCRTRVLFRRLTPGSHVSRI
jgi:predicted SprT family Zn-dependent metalloprotease